MACPFHSLHYLCITSVTSHFRHLPVTVSIHSVSGVRGTQGRPLTASIHASMILPNNGYMDPTQQLRRATNGKSSSRGSQLIGVADAVHLLGRHPHRHECTVCPLQKSTTRTAEDRRSPKNYILSLLFFNCYKIHIF